MGLSSDTGDVLRETCLSLNNCHPRDNEIIKTSLRRFIRSKAKSGEKARSELSSLSGSTDWTVLSVLDLLGRGMIDLVIGIA